MVRSINGLDRKYPVVKYYGENRILNLISGRIQDIYVIQDTGSDIRSIPRYNRASLLRVHFLCV